MTTAIGESAMFDVGLGIAWRGIANPFGLPANVPLVCNVQCAMVAVEIDWRWECNLGVRMRFVDRFRAT